MKNVNNSVSTIELFPSPISGKIRGKSRKNFLFTNHFSQALENSENSCLFLVLRSIKFLQIKNYVLQTI